MALQTTAFNPVDYLKGDEEIADYLTEAYQDDDPAVFVAALGNAATPVTRTVAVTASSSGGGGDGLDYLLLTIMLLMLRAGHIRRVS